MSENLNNLPSDTCMEYGRVVHACISRGFWKFHMHQAPYRRTNLL